MTKELEAALLPLKSALADANDAWAAFIEKLEPLPDEWRTEFLEIADCRALGIPLESKGDGE